MSNSKACTPCHKAKQIKRAMLNQERSTARLNKLLDEQFKLDDSRICVVCERTSQDTPMRTVNNNPRKFICFTCFDNLRAPQLPVPAPASFSDQIIQGMTKYFQEHPPPAENNIQTPAQYMNERVASQLSAPASGEVKYCPPHQPPRDQRSNFDKFPYPSDDPRSGSLYLTNYGWMSTKGNPPHSSRSTPGDAPGKPRFRPRRGR
jgi:hypothetical protein